MEPFTAGAPLFFKSELSQTLNSGDQALDWWGRHLSNEDAYGACDRRYRLNHFIRAPSLNKEHVWRWTWGWVVSVMLAKQPMDDWRTPSHNPNSDTTGSPRWSLAWTDGEPLILTSNVMRNPCSVNCHASHACEAALALCSWPLCRESGFAMRLRLPGPWPGNVSPEAVFATPMCLRLPNVSSQSSSPTQCVFAMRLRHPMRLHNASAPPNAFAPSNASSPNASSECVCACSCVCPYWAFF